MMAYNSSSVDDDRGDNGILELEEHGDLDNKPVYLLEHLATFTVNKESGIIYPADGMRKLLQLEKTTGIWSQKMQLCLDRQWVLIMDYESQNIIERFPATLIQEPTAFTSNDPIEMYNNILVFIVGGESSSRSEMHIFQCQSISAVHLVEDLKQLRSGKMITKYREPMMMAGSSSKQQQQQQHHHQQQQQQQQHHQQHQIPLDYQHGQDTDSELGGLNDETSSTSSEKYEREVTVLNHCFDDIEKFIARLQHAAAASRELERRRRSRRSKKKDPGEGLLTLRTRPPHEKEFIDIFAKFKLSFNLLAKLKAHIHDPNAPELVHFLFTPLALIVDASHDSYYDPNLPARVNLPLLTREAINLLINCVTSKETELWRSLGDTWTIPRDQWKGQIGSYHPVFFDGWSPDFPVVDDMEIPSPGHHKSSKRLIGIGGGLGQSSSSQNDYNFDYDFEDAPIVTTTGILNVPPPGSPIIRDFSTRSEISIDSIERNGGNGNAIITTAPMERERERERANSGGIDLATEQWIEELQARDAKIVQVTYPRTANNDKELTVVRGEFLEIMDDTRKWWKARNIRGRIAHIPHTIVSQHPYTGDNSSSIGGGGGGGGGEAMYSQQSSQNYGKNRHDDQQQQNVMNADWVRNKHQGKKGEFRYF
ncbi:unnamed protein product [Diamesa serratosioi]